MKKLALLLLICLLGCTALFAAAETAEEIDPASLLGRAQAVAEDLEELIVMTADDLYDLIGIEYEDYTDYAYLAHVDSLTGRELIILRAVDEEAAQRDRKSVV